MSEGTEISALSRVVNRYSDEIAALKRELAAMTDRAERAEAVQSFFGQTLEQIEILGTKWQDAEDGEMVPTRTPEAQLAESALSNSAIQAAIEHIKRLGQ